MIKIKIENDSKKDIYTSVLHHFNITDEWELTPNEVKILGEMCYKLNELVKGGLSYNDANVIIFNKEFKDEISNRLEISSNTYANTLSKLRKLDLIIENKISKNILFNIPKKLDLLISYEDKENI